jgi:hypothetical protein
VLHICTHYDFSYAFLMEAFHHIFGDQAYELNVEETAGTALELPRGFKLDDSEESFTYLKTFLTHKHEELHVKHLLASPLGLALHLVLVNEQHGMGRYLTEWGRQVGMDLGANLSIPLAKSNANHSSIRRIQGIRRRHKAAIRVVMNAPKDWSDKEAIPAAETMLEVVQTHCRDHLGFADRFPAIGRMANLNLSVCPQGLSGNAVAEALVRCAEYILTTKLTQDAYTVNRVFLLKHHGHYALPLEFTRQLLGLTRGIDVSTVTVFCADLALQAPILPFLLRGRDAVSLEELLPGCRFFVLVGLCGSREITPQDILADPVNVAKKLFGILSWEDPWSLARRIQQLDMPTPRDPMMGYCLNLLKVGAKIRLTDPMAISRSGESEGTHLLGPLFSIFTDRISPGATGQFFPRLGSQPMVEHVIRDVTMESILADSNLHKSLHLARLYREFLERMGLAELMKSPDTPASIVREYLAVIVGDLAASRIMARLNRDGSQFG